MGFVTRHWPLADAMHAAVSELAAHEGVSLAEWVRVALTDWVADLPQVRLTAPEVTEEDPGVPLLPDWAADGLRALAKDPSPKRLSVWLALLSEAEWPLAAAGTVLGWDTQKVSNRVAAGWRLLEDPASTDLFQWIPDVPAPPVTAQRIVVDEHEQVGFTMRIDVDLVEAVAEKAALERMPLIHAVRTAIRARLAALGLDADGTPFDDIAWPLGLPEIAAHLPTE